MEMLWYGNAYNNCHSGGFILYLKIARHSYKSACNKSFVVVGVIAIGSATSQFDIALKSLANSSALSISGK